MPGSNSSRAAFIDSRIRCFQQAQSALRVKLKSNLEYWEERPSHLGIEESADGHYGAGNK
jgi:hypothetical protein